MGFFLLQDSEWPCITQHVNYVLARFESNHYYKLSGLAAQSFVKWNYLFSHPHLPTHPLCK